MKLLGVSGLLVLCHVTWCNGMSCYVRSREELSSVVPCNGMQCYELKTPLFSRQLLCTTKYDSRIQRTTPKYNPVLQSTTPVLLCTRKYDSSTTPVLLQYYSVLQRTSPVLLCTTKYYSSTTPILLCTTVLQSTTQVLLQYYSVLHYYKVLLQFYKILQSATLCYKVLLQHYKVLQSATPVLQSTTPLLQNYKALLCTTSTTPVLLWNVIYIAHSNRHRPHTSPNTTPATQNECHDWSCSHMKPHLQCAEQQASPSHLTKYCACHAKGMSWLILLTYEASFTIAGATGITLTPHQNTAPATQKECHDWSCLHINVIYNARSDSHHPATSPNTAPATQKECHDWSCSHMKRHLQRAALTVPLPAGLCLLLTPQAQPSLLTPSPSPSVDPFAKHPFPSPSVDPFAKASVDPFAKDPFPPTPFPFLLFLLSSSLTTHACFVKGYPCGYPFWQELLCLCSVAGQKTFWQGSVEKNWFEPKILAGKQKVHMPQQQKFPCKTNMPTTTWTNLSYT